jgi:hypothetical protein
VKFRTPSRRTAAVATSVFIGIMGPLSSGAAAGAQPAALVPTTGHHAALTGVASCTTDRWVARWKLTTSETHGAVGVVSNIKFTSPPVKQVPGGPTQPPTLTKFVDGAQFTGDGMFTEDQTFGYQTKTAELSFMLTWHDGPGVYSALLRSTAKLPAGCAAGNPAGIPPIAAPTVRPPGSGEDPESPTPNPPQNPVHPTSTTAALAAAGDDATGGGGLPVTGAATGTIAGGAVLLLGVGGLLLVASRRRRVKFTA